MIHAGLETRLHLELGRPSPGPPDPAVWADIQERAEAERQQAAAERTGTNRRRLAYVAAVSIVAAGVLSQVGTLRNQNLADPAEPVATPPVASGPVPLWWLVAAVVIGLAVMAFVHRSMRDKIVTLGLAVAVAGGLAASALMLGSIQTGSELAAHPPTIEGYEVVGIDQPWIPPSDGSRLVRFHYRRAATGSEAEKVVTGYEELLTVVQDSGFEFRPAGKHCLEVERENSNEPGLYCLSDRELDKSDGMLDVDGSVSTPGNHPTALVLLVVAAVGLALAVAVGADHRTGDPCDPKRRAMTLAVFAVGTAATLMAGTTAILLRTSSTASSMNECPGGLRSSSVMAELNRGGVDGSNWDSQLSDCLHEFAFSFTENGLLVWARALQLPVLIAIDAIAAGLVVGGWLLAKRAELSKGQLLTLGFIAGFGGVLALAQPSLFSTIRDITVFFS